MKYSGDHIIELGLLELQHTELDKEITNKNLVFGVLIPPPGYNLKTTSEIAQNIKISTNSHFFQVEFWVKNFLYKKNLTFKFEPLKVKDKSRGANSFKIKNSIKVIYNFFKLLFYSLFYRLKN